MKTKIESALWVESHRCEIDKCSWKTIPEFPLYEIGDRGYVRRKDTMKILVNKLTKDGYAYVTLYNGSRNSAAHRRVHRLVAISFIPNPNNLQVVHHINSDVSDNSVTNLKWETIVYHNAAERNTVNTSFSEMNITSKSKAVLQYDRHKNFIRYYKSMSEAARFIQMQIPNVKIDTIRRFIGNSISHKTRLAYGYKWKLERVKD